ncbi:respiratory chain complex I subunit 1 family protein [Clostridium thermarum]|uniref:respiratory chain complex I subunit 1 family protein n=1 Tax=Clostridium thermarum TaxID=1716543 RepID=UPI001122A3BD|nr:complex I subunit 1 family protein [Clostridium thermarum]
MDWINSVIMPIFYVLVFPGFLFCFIVGLLLAGIDRKVVARFQRRVGPPLLQPFYDFFKLVGKLHIIPGRASEKVFLLAPILGFLSIVTIPLFIPIFGEVWIPGTADIIVLIYLLTVPAIALILGGSASGSPYAGVGISREVVTMLSYELPLVIVLLAVGAKAGFSIDGKVTFSLSKIHEFQVLNGVSISHWTLIPAAIAFLLIIPAEVGSVPFDVAEAETEICEGPLVEYSGFYLGIYKLTQAIKILVMGSLFAALFLGGEGFVGVTGNDTIDLILNIVLLIIIMIVVTVVCISFVKAVVARVKVEQLLKFFWTIPTALALLSLILVYLKL